MKDDESTRQAAEGSFIAQALGEGAQAKVEVTQQAPLSPTLALAPAPPAHFTGRRHVIVALEDTLVPDNAPVRIALLGMGGIGKTATALQVASELSPAFPGGIFWAALPEHDGNPRPILRAWGRACAQDLSTEPESNVLADLVRALLAERQIEMGPLLVIVDDVRTEWLEAAQILKQAVPGDVPLLLTTRNETLAAALGAFVHRLEGLPHDEALELLRAHAGRPIVDADPQASDELLKIMGYLPLAIELAGKRLSLLARKPGYRMATLSAAVAERAAETLGLPGHRGLAATFSITYETLPLELQRLFRWLSVFASGPLKATHIASLMELDPSDTESALDELVLPALLTWGESEGTYALHPLLRQYAGNLLNQHDEMAEAGRLHTAHFLSFAQAHALADPAAWDRLETELPNLMLAARRAADAKDVASLVSFEETLLHDSLFLNVRAYYREAVELFTKSLGAQEYLGEQKNRPRTLNKLAWFHICLDEEATAQEYAEEAYRLARALNNQEQQADSLRYLGIIFDGRGQFQQALAQFEKQLEIRRELDDPSRLANCLNDIAMVRIALGDYARAKQHLDQAIKICDHIGDKQSAVEYRGYRGIPSLYLGDYESAFEDFKTALSQSRQQNFLNDMARNLLNMGIAQRFLGDPMLAMQMLEEALSLWRKIDHRPGEFLTLTTLAEVFCALGAYRQSAEYLRVVGEQIHEIGDVETELEYLNTLGMLHCEQGEYEQALAVFRDMQLLAADAGLGYFVAQSKLGLVRSHLGRAGRDDLRIARRTAAEAVATFREMQLAGDEPRAHAYLAEANLLLGKKETALQHCRKAMRLLDQQKHVHGSEAEILLIAIQVLGANGLVEERRRLLQRAYDSIRATAAKISDETLRKSYLGAPINRQLAEIWEGERVTGG